MAIQGLLFVLGLALLYAGAEALVRGASSLALRFGVAPLVVGLTVVAFGTSAPELTVSVLAGARGSGGVALGNVVGSNIFNVGAVLGGAALIRALAVEARLVAREIPLMIAFSCLLPLLAWDGFLSRLDGVLLLLGFGTYMGYVVATATRGAQRGRTAEDEGVPGAGRTSAARASLLVVVGLGGLVAGGHFLVGASVSFARAAGIPELVVGLTIVAAGTSLPELATSLVAAARRETDIAIGNVVGSNVFNLGAILGTSAMVSPLAAPSGLLRLEIPVMLGLSLLVLPLGFTDRAVRRGEGAFLVAIYVGFLALVTARAVAA